MRVESAGSGATYSVTPRSAFRAHNFTATPLPRVSVPRSSTPPLCRRRSSRSLTRPGSGLATRAERKWAAAAESPRLMTAITSRAWARALAEGAGDCAAPVVARAAFMPRNRRRAVVIRELDPGCWKKVTSGRTRLKPRSGSRRCIAVPGLARREPALEPAEPLGRRSMGEGLRAHRAGRCFLEPVVSHSGRRIQALFSITLLEQALLRRVVPPHAGEAISLQLQPDRRAVGPPRGTALPRIVPEQVLDVMTQFVRDHIRL